MVDHDRELELLSERIKGNSEFQALRKRRSRFSWTLTGVLLGCYYGFAITVAFNPDLVATPLHADTVITLGIPLGLGVILLALSLTGIYVACANAIFDSKTRDIIADAKRSIKISGHDP